MSDRAAIPTTRRRSWRVVIAMLVGAVGVIGAAVASPPVHAVAADCEYGTGGPAADTFCWFDMSGYSEAEATSVDGQPFEVSLGGGYLATFTLHKTNISGFVPATVAARQAPLEPRFAFGTAGYAGMTSSPILYSNNPGGGTKGVQLTLSDIEVVDSGGNPVRGYRFVIADAENNVAGEDFTWTSDETLDLVAVLNAANPNGCSLPLVGTGTQTVTCTGAGGGPGPYNGVLVGSEAPSFISLRMTTFAQSGVAFAIQTAKLTLGKSVAERVNASDGFDISITSPEGAVLASDSTGTADSADTGSTVVLPRLDAGEYVLGEAATAGTPTVLSNYDQSWDCSNETAGSTTVLPSGTGTSKAVSPAAGDDIRCTITNTARERSIALLKRAGAPIDVDGDGIIGAGDLIPYTFDVTNTGELTLGDIGIAEVFFDGSGLPAPSCPLSSLGPLEEQQCSVAYPLTQEDVDRGSVTNTATAHGTPPGAENPVVSPPSSVTVDIEPSPALSLVKTADRERIVRAGEVVTYTFTITNIGNVTLFDPNVEEREFTGSGETPDPVCPGGVTELRPRESLECEARYTAVAADLDGEVIRNTAVATASTSDGDVVLSTLSTALVNDRDAIALTGSELASLAIVAAVLLIGGGAALVVVRRRTE